MPKLKNKHIALIMGGLSSERDVSLSSGTQVEKALHNLGHKVTTIDVQSDICTKLQKTKPDIVFNALHGTYGEDGCIQGLLELMKIPYTHSGVLASALAMNKKQTKNILQNHDITLPKDLLLTRKKILTKKINFPFPFVIKPVSEGSSIGTLIIHNKNDLPNSQTLGDFSEFLIEEYIAGKELSTTVTDDQPLGVVEIKPKTGFYNYHNKYTANMTEHLVPAPITKSIYKQAMDTAHKVHNIIGCRGISRSDFILCNTTNKLFFLEINTHPGLTPLSLAPEAAKHAGITFDQLIQYLLEKAQCEK